MGLYTRKKDDEILSKYSPFFFSDVNFDGKEELLINDYNGGARGSNAYEVYEVSPYHAEILKDPPFNVLEDGITEFDPKNKTRKNLQNSPGEESIRPSLRASGGRGG